MKRIISISALVIFLMTLSMFSIFFLSSCTENTRTKLFGGTMEIEIPKGYTVTMATWKNGHTLFYMYEEMDSTYIPKTKYFVEKSNFGIVESTVIFKESR